LWNEGAAAQTVASSARKEEINSTYSKLEHSNTGLAVLPDPNLLKSSPFDACGIRIPNFFGTHSDLQSKLKKQKGCAEFLRKLTK
jgi:hypothetical protein